MPAPNDTRRQNAPQLAGSRSSRVDDEVNQNSAVVASERIRAQSARREQQFRAWDKLVLSDQFKDFLRERDFVLRDESALPPRDLEAEQAVLGALLRAEPEGNGDVVPIAMETLHAVMFSSRANAYIFTAVRQLHKRRSAGGIHKDLMVDYVSVATTLRRMGKLESQGGEVPAYYLTHLHSTCPCSANIRAYMEPVVETYKLRTVHLACQELARMCSLPDADAQKLSCTMFQIADEIAHVGRCNIKSILNLQ